MTLGLILWAALAQPAALSDPPKAVPKTPPATTSKAEVPVEEKLCSVSVANLDLAKVVQELSTQTKANLVLLAEPDKKLTLRLSGVRFIDMLRHICALTGLRHLKIGNTFVLATEEQLKAGYAAEWEEANPKPIEVQPVAPEVITKTYITNFVDSTQIAASLEKVFDKQVLTIVGGPGQVSPSVTFRDTSGTTGISTGIIERDGIAETRTGRMLILRGTQEVVDLAIEMARTLDYPRPQVAISVTIHDISNEALRELGLSWSFSGFVINEQDPKNIGFGSFSRTPLSFASTIRALEKEDKAKLLASPNISALDGERAFILIGNRINFPVLVGFSQSNTPIFEKQEERVGIYLQVAASVANEKDITLSIYPQVSAITSFLEVNNASYPQISTREAQTTIRVSSGETIVLGGMLKDEELYQIEKVPLLSDLPIIGELFKRRKRTKVSSQVIITITPVVLNPEK